jgi:molybdopterin synthase catalytic subunit
MISVRVQSAPFDLAQECAALRQRRIDIGALVTFTGLVRDYPMTLEHYPALAEAEMCKLAKEAAARWNILAGTIVHRFGPLLPGDDIVLVAIASAHRAAAFDCAHFLMDWLKTRAPFWKLEGQGDGRAWVAAKAEDDEAAARWTRI